MNRNKMNGHATKLVNGSTCEKDVPGEAVDILKHIAEISQVSGPHFSTRFMPLSGPGRAEHDRMKNHRKLPQPRNIKLTESESEDEDTGNTYRRTTEEVFDENAILAGIRSMCGGRESSNRYLQQRWTRQQRDSDDNSRVTNFKQDVIEPNKAKGNRDVFARNVGMRAILRQRMEKNVNSVTGEDTAKDSGVGSNQDAKNVGANSCSFPFIQDSVDPDFLCRQFLGLDNNDDYIVEHVGKITSVTPRKYLIENIDDAAFIFSRQNK